MLTIPTLMQRQEHIKQYLITLLWIFYLYLERTTGSLSDSLL